ncbi:MAG: PAS domain-containing sensor histidine kinase [Bacteroidaceae bacterium]|nr:PAS domain-containing sensor histidine kinase [Bacteroidaceae bacterium]
MDIVKLIACLQAIILKDHSLNTSDSLAILFLFATFFIVVFINPRIKRLRDKEETENQFQFSIFNGLSVPFALLDVDNRFRVTYWNKALEDIFYVDKESLIAGRDFYDVKQTITVNQQVFKTKKTFHAEETIILKSGKLINTDTYKKYMTDGVHRFIFMIRIDITELLSVREKVRKSKERQIEFVRNINHEIRTPLNSIIGYKDLLLSAEESKERQDFVAIIKDGSKRLYLLIDNFLLISKIHSNELLMVSKKTELNHFIHLELRSIKETFNRPQVKVRFDFPYLYLQIATMPEVCHLILQQFIQNAFKYTTRGQVQIGYLLEGKTLFWYIQDTGIGIPQKNWVKIFNRFEKIDNFSPGGGLGLFICKELLLHKPCKIGVYSRVGVGSLFWVSTPCTVYCGTESINPKVDVGAIRKILSMRQYGIYFESDGKKMKMVRGDKMKVGVLL